MVLTACLILLSHVSVYAREVIAAGAGNASVAPADSNLTFLTPPDKVNLLKAVTDPQLEGEIHAQPQGMAQCSCHHACFTFV